ncbi:Uncharacterised protein [Salmonella enterica subsp. salamae]|uniref:Uncharacterized protein n=1 Tax=Salmonella enterica subsp. salamae TaxID=59202 RepID=A0A6D2GE59_SALER|nr:Uncharacterised protein [Salmonella enterica subsp. salamae]
MQLKKTRLARFSHITHGVFIASGYSRYWRLLSRLAFLHYRRRHSYARYATSRAP